MSIPTLVRRRLFPSVVAVSSLFVAMQPSSATVAAQGAGRIDVLITFASPPGPADQALVRAAGGQVKYAYRIVPGMAASLPAQAVAALRSNPRIQAIEPDGRVQAYQFGTEYELAWGVGRIGSESVHASGLSGAGVRVAVFDTGVEYSHFELAHAWAGGYDFANDDGDPVDDNGHGTHVAGTIAAAADGQWVVGVAPNVQLHGVKVLDAAGSGDWSDVIAGLDWAVLHGIQVTNHSYGDAADPGSLVEQAFVSSAAAGMVHVAAAGNSGNCRGTGNSVGYPARFDAVIAVAATDELDDHACFSSSGPAVELSAPGSNIVSSYWHADIAIGSGTSMASPHVAGAAALVMAAGVLDPAAVRNLLAATALDLGGSGRDKVFGFGLIDVAAAVAAAGPIPPAVHVALSTDKASYDPAETTAVLTVSVTSEVGTPLTGVPFASFETTFDGVAVPLIFTETATPGTYSSQLDIASAAEGQHAVTVTVTFGQVGADTAAFQIGTPPAPGTAHVPAISYDSRGGRGGTRDIYITVPVVDGDGAPVAGAAVGVIVWVNGLPWAYGEGTTDGSGEVTFEGRNTPSGTYFTEVVAVVAGGLVWDGVTPPNSFVK